MSHETTAWGIEIGAYAIKALRLVRQGDAVLVTDFAYIPHKKVLTTPDLDQNELVRLSLGQFISQKSLEGEHLVMSVPGHAAFARFAKLPPVEPKKVPDIVKFEAVQQIPFPIEQVEWDYQTFMADDSPEVEVGIFAITRDRVQQRLGLYAELGLTPEALTLSPVAVYNAMSLDYNLADHSGPIVFLDIGTQATDVIVAEEGRCWIRTFPLGGTHFTEAIASAFKLSYSKAEKLKCESATSKYAKQIMQAMRPVFSDLLQDLQRSIGYYQSAHSEHELKVMVGIGSTFKIPGLRKFLGQQLQMDVVRLDEYRKIQVTGREAASFAENAVNMATAYGLALQGVGLGAIDANLVPVKALRDQLWHAKTKWFAAAAAIGVLGAGMMLVRPLVDGRKVSGPIPQVAVDVLEKGKRLRSEFETESRNSEIGFTATNVTRLLEHRTIWPHLVHDAALALAAAAPQEALLGDDADKILGVDPERRRFVQLNELTGMYAPPAGSGNEKTPRRINVTMVVDLSHDRPADFLNSSVGQWLRDNADRETSPYRIIPDTIKMNPELRKVIEVGESGEETVRGGGGGGAGRPASRAPSRPRPSGPGLGGQPVMPAGSTPGQKGSGSLGRNVPRGPKRQAPGGNIGGGMGQAGSAPVGGGGMGSTPSGRMPMGGSADPGGSSRPSPSQVNLNEMAPIKGRPARYPAGTEYYRIPVTFTVEILDESRPADSSQADRGGTRRQEGA